jgi:exonuclease III
LLDASFARKSYVIGLQETQLAERYQINNQTPGYRIFGRTHGGPGSGPDAISRTRGTLLLVRNDVQASPVLPVDAVGKQKSKWDWKNGELTAVRVLLPGIGPVRSIFILNIYATSSKLQDWGSLPKLEELQKLTRCDTADGKVDLLMLMGDLNAHHPSWDPYLEEDSRGKQVIKALEDRGLKSINNGSPTRKSPENQDRRDSVPDVVAVSKSHEAFFSSRVQDDFEGSDHLPIVTEFRANGGTIQSKPAGFTNVYRDDVDWSGFSSDMEQAVSRDVSERNIKGEIKWFSSLLVKAGKSAGHIRWASGIFRPRSRKEGASEEEQKWIQEAFDSVKNDSSQSGVSKLGGGWGLRKAEEFEKTIRENGALRKLLQCGRTCSASDIFRILDPKPKSSVISALPIWNGKEILTTDKAKCEVFSKHYAKISEKKSFSETEKKWKGEVESQVRDGLHLARGFGMPEVTAIELQRVIRSLTKGSSTGIDLISNDMFCNLGPLALERLRIIINRVIDSGYVDPVWKKCVICPIPKTSHADTPVDFRPISLCSCFCKLVEGIVEVRIRYHAQVEGLISGRNFGFQEGRNTDDAIEEMMRGYDEKGCAVLFDFFKCFDTIWLSALNKVLLDSDIPPKYIFWVREWCQDRLYSVRIGSEYSAWRHHPEGLPQGARLSPVLCILFLESLINSIIDMVGFADDAGVTCIPEEIQQRIDQVLAWAKKWKMGLNIKKTVILVKNDAVHRQTFHIDQDPIKPAEFGRYLGLLWDRKGSFRQHADKVEKCVRAALGPVNSASRAGFMVGRSAYLALAESKAAYVASIWWKRISVKSQNKINRALRECIRAYTGIAVGTKNEILYLEGLTLDMETIATTRGKILNNQRTTNSKKRCQWKPWTKGAIPSVSAFMKGAKAMSVSKDLIAADINDCLRRINADVEIYTDGSYRLDMSPAVKNFVGGSGLCIRVRRVDGGWSNWKDSAYFIENCICSYDTEAPALEEAIKSVRDKVWLENGGVSSTNHTITKVVIASDALSLLTEIENCDHRYTDLLEQVSDDIDLHFVFTPSHCGVVGNERADIEAERGTDRDSADLVKTGFIRHALRRENHIIKKVAKEEFIRNIMENTGSGSVKHYRRIWGYSAELPVEGKEKELFSENKLKQFRNKCDYMAGGVSGRLRGKVTAQFRAGNCVYLKSFAGHQGRGGNTCPDCKSAADTVFHMLTECPIHYQARQGYYDLPGQFVDDAEAAVSYLQKTLARRRVWNLY